MTARPFDEIATISREYAELKPVVTQIAEWRRRRTPSTRQQMLADPRDARTGRGRDPRLRAAMPDLEPGAAHRALPKDAADARPAIMEIRPAPGRRGGAVRGRSLGMYRRLPNRQGLAVSNAGTGGSRSMACGRPSPGSRARASLRDEI